MKLVVVGLAGTAVVSAMMESQIAGLNIPRDMRSMMAQMAADPPRRLTAEEKAVADAEHAAMVEQESTEGGGLRKLQDSNTYWYVEKKCGEQLQNFCTDTGMCGRGEGVVLDTCVPIAGSSVAPWQFSETFQSAIWSIKDPDIDGEEDEIKYKISVKFWDVANCAGGHDGSWPTNDQVGVADYLFNQCDFGLWRKRDKGKPWEEFQLSEVQNKDAFCTTPRFFSGYDMLETCLKGPYAGQFATCTASSYVQYDYSVDDPTCQGNAKVVIQSHVTDVCTPVGFEPIPGEFIEPLGLEFTGNELMYYCADHYSEDDEDLTIMIVIYALFTSIIGTLFAAALKSDSIKQRGYLIVLILVPLASACSNISSILSKEYAHGLFFFLSCVFLLTSVVPMAYRMYKLGIEPRVMFAYPGYSRFSPTLLWLGTVRCKVSNCVVPAFEGVPLTGIPTGTPMLVQWVYAGLGQGLSLRCGSPPRCMSLSLWFLGASCTKAKAWRRLNFGICGSVCSRAVATTTVLPGSTWAS